VGGEFGARCAGVGAAALKGWRKSVWLVCGTLQLKSVVLCCACPRGENAT
jgi:hypothetical protein